MPKPIVRPIYTVHQDSRTEPVHAVILVTTDRKAAIQAAIEGLWCCQRTPESGWFEDTTWVEEWFDGEPDSACDWIAHEEGLQP